MSELLSMDRRAMLAQVAALIGAASLPTGALAVPQRRAAHFLGAPQFALLGAVAGTIIPATDTPGAIAAQVPARLDALLLNWASAATRTKIVGALDRIEAAARTAKHKGFVAFTSAERATFLQGHDAAALKTVPPPADAPKPSFFVPANYVADQGYLSIKELVIHLYYYSEVAASQELIYEHVPGQWQPSIKLTPQSRPYLGTGQF